MKKVITLIVLIVLFSCKTTQNQTTATKTIINAKKNAKGNLVGVANRASFKQAPYLNWFNKNYADYKVDEATVSEIKKYLKGVKIKGFMGTWCGDSKRETPHFYNLLDKIGYDESNLEMITVNRSKRTPDNLQEGLNIKRIPTFIFYKGGKEIGRYVEYPRETLEKDILKIVSGQPYKHSYDK